MSSPAPKISVCLLTYNRAGFLDACLSTILNQTFTDFELLVCDNCSTDETAEVVARFSDTRIRYHRNERNIGPYPNMNRALELARGDYVCILHDDDLYAPCFLEQEAELLDRNLGVGMVHCAVHEIDADGSIRRMLRAYPTTRVLDGRKEFVRFLCGHNVCCSSVMVRRRLYHKVGGFESRYLCADFLMWLKLALQADVGYVAEPLVRMRVHDDTVTSWLDPGRWYQEFIEIMGRGFEMAAETYPAILTSRQALVRKAARVQGRRFLIAALSAAAQGNVELARGYVGVVERFQADGAPRLYVLLARIFANSTGATIIRRVRRIRRAWGSRAALRRPIR